MQEEIAKGAIAVVKFFVYWIIWSIMLFNLGRVTLLAVSLGRYPRGLDAARHANRISLAGILVLLVAWLLVATYNNTVGIHASHL